MNEQLQNALAEIIQKAIATGEAAAEFLVAETPDVVYQLLLWYGVKTAVLFFTGLAIWLIVACILRDMLRNPKRWKIDPSKDGTTFCMATIYVICGPVLIAAGLELTSNNYDWLQILIAPKIWLLEYAAELVK